MLRPPISTGAASRLLKYLQIVTLLVLLMYFGKGLLIPLFFGLLIAMVMYPVCLRLEALRLRRSLAITVCLLIVTLLFIALIFLLMWQVSLFRQDMPELAAKLRSALPGIQYWLQSRLDISVDMQQEWLRQTAMGMSGNAGLWLQSTLNATATTLFLLMLIPIYAALFLYHRETFVRFLHKVVGEKHRLETDIVVRETIQTYSSYIKGMILVYIIVGILNSIGLLALGIRHAVLFGMITAIMTIIPYVGIVVSASLPIAVAFITTDSIWYPIGVILVFSVVQYLEANVIFPKVVGKQLNISTWAMLVAIIAGGLIWGVSGMVLFIPFVAILKIASEHVKGMEAINIILNRKAPSG